MYETILLLFYHCIPTAAEIDAAYSLARRYNSYIEGLFVPHLYQAVVGVDIVSHSVQSIEDDKVAAQLAAAARQAFYDLLNDRGIPGGTVDEVNTDARGYWIESDGSSETIIGENVRLFDLAIVRRNSADKGSFWQAAAEGVLF